MESLWFRYSHVHWCYVKDGSDSEGDDCGWVDYVQWTGLTPGHDPANWDTITYKYARGEPVESTRPAGNSMSKPARHTNGG